MKPPTIPELIDALVECRNALSGVLQPLDHEELKQPIYRRCDKAWDRAEAIIKRDAPRRSNK